MNNNIIFRIAGRTTGGLVPIVNIGGMTYEVNDQARFSGKKYYTIRNLQDYTLYTIHYPRIVSSTGRPGLWVMELGIPRNHAIVSVTSGNCMSVFDLLQYLSNCLLDIYMINEGNGNYRYNNLEINEGVFQQIIDGYNVKYVPRKTTYMLSNIKEPYATLIVSNEAQIKDLFDDTNYEEFCQYSEVIVALEGSGQSLATSTSLSGIIIPRPVNYKVYVNNKFTGNIAGKDKFFRAEIQGPKPYHKHTPLEFSINSVGNNSSIQVNHIQEEVHCQIQEYGIEYKCLLVKNSDYKYSGNTSGADFVIELIGEVDELNLNDLRLKDRDGRYATETLKSDGAFCLHGDEIGANWVLEYNGSRYYKVSDHTLQIGKSTSARVEVKEYDPNIYVYIVGNNAKCSNERSQNSRIIEITTKDNFDIKGLVLVQNNNRLEVTQDVGDSYFIIQPEQQANLLWQVEYNNQPNGKPIDLSKKKNSIRLNVQSSKPIQMTLSQPTYEQWQNRKEQKKEAIRLKLIIPDSYDRRECIKIILFDQTRSVIFKTRHHNNGEIIDLPQCPDWFCGGCDFDMKSANYHIDIKQSTDPKRSDFTCRFIRKSLWERINKSNLIVILLSILLVTVLGLYVFAMIVKPAKTGNDPIVTATKTESIEETTPSPNSGEDSFQDQNDEDFVEDIEPNADSLALHEQYAEYKGKILPYNNTRKWDDIVSVRNWLKKNKDILAEYEIDCTDLQNEISISSSMEVTYTKLYDEFNKSIFDYKIVRNAKSWHSSTDSKWSDAYERDGDTSKKLSKRYKAYLELQSIFEKNKGQFVGTQEKLELLKTTPDYQYLFNEHKKWVEKFCELDKYVEIWIKSGRINTTDSQFLKNLSFAYKEIEAKRKPSKN